LLEKIVAMIEIQISESEWILSMYFEKMYFENDEDLIIK